MMEHLEELQTIFEQDYYEFEDEDWDKDDDWLDELRRESSFIQDEALRIKSIETDQGSETRTIITYYSDESEASIGSKSAKSLVSTESKESLTDSVLSLSNLPIDYPLPNPDIKGAFWILYPNPPVYTSDGVDKFFDYVEILKLAPISGLKKELRSDAVILKYYGIDPDVIQPLSQALRFNNTVKTLDLQDNLLTPSACYHLNKLLLRNTTLNSLNLSGCRIGLEGAMKLEDGISLSSALRELNLSRCNLRNDGFYYIARSVAANSLIKKLDISDNNLNEESANQVYKVVNSTESLEYLNLSWNDFYSKDAIELIFTALIKNSTLLGLEMTWNAMGKNSIGFIRSFIMYTRNLQYLDLSANRFGDDEAQSIAYAVSKNRSLLEFHFNKNPLTSPGVASFIRSLTTDEFITRSPLRLLDFESHWAAKVGLPAIEQLKQLKPTLNIKLCGILENFNIVGPDLKELFFKTANYDAMNVKKKKERRNFGHFVLSLPDTKINKEKFIKLVETSRIPISENLAREIANQFLVTKKIVDLEALKESYLYYFPDTELPKPKATKEDGKKGSSKKKKNKSKKKKGKKGKKK